MLASLLPAPTVAFRLSPAAEYVRSHADPRLYQQIVHFEYRRIGGGRVLLELWSPCLETLRVVTDSIYDSGWRKELVQVDFIEKTDSGISMVQYIEAAKRDGVHTFLTVGLMCQHVGRSTVLRNYPDEYQVKVKGASRLRLQDLLNKAGIRYELLDSGLRIKKWQ